MSGAGTVYGQDSSGNQIALLVDATGRPLVVLDALTQTPLRVSSGASGGILLNWKADYHEVIASGNHAAGAVTLQSSAVAAGEVWHVDAITVQNFTSAVAGTTMLFSIVGPSVSQLLPIPSNITALTTWADKYDLWLSVGAKISAVFSASNLNDNCQLRVHGYKGYAA